MRTADPVAGSDASLLQVLSATKLEKRPVSFRVAVFVRREKTEIILVNLVLLAHPNTTHWVPPWGALFLLSWCDWCELMHRPQPPHTMVSESPLFFARLPIFMLVQLQR